MSSPYTEQHNLRPRRKAHPLSCSLRLSSEGTVPTAVPTSPTQDTAWGLQNPHQCTHLPPAAPQLSTPM